MKWHERCMQCGVCKRHKISDARGKPIMSIQKKSLISTLKTAKKANVASTGDVDVKGSKVASMKMTHKVAAKASARPTMKAAPRPAFKTALKASAKASFRQSLKAAPKNIA